MLPRYTSFADTHAMVARIVPSIIDLLGDGIPRSRRAFVAALAESQARMRSCAPSCVCPLPAN